MIAKAFTGNWKRRKPCSVNRVQALYPDLEPYTTHRLAVDARHTLYLEECGNASGIPVVFLHGGPGSGCKAYHRCFFNPQRYRIILYDQRGCGRSTPFGELTHNTTPHLVEDLDRIRHWLGIERWLLFGGSWGATLALLYAQAFTERVLGLILRGSFLARQCDLDWFVKDGVNRIYPEQWQLLIADLDDSERRDIVTALHRRLREGDKTVSRRAAQAWSAWGGQVALGTAFDPTIGEQDDGDESLIGQAGIELHYAVHRYFIEENQILEHCRRLRGLPTAIIHGRCDLVCPAEAAYRLKQQLADAELTILPDAGHIANGDPAMIDALLHASDAMVARFS